MNALKTDDMYFFDDSNKELHQDNEQLKRQKSALKLHIISIDEKNNTGIINDYEVTLYSCTCVDFNRRKLPCKHMYRLAHELGIFHLDGKVINDTKIKSSQKVEIERAIKQAHTYELTDNEIYFISFYRTLPFEEQQKLFNYLYTLSPSVPFEFTEASVLDYLNKSAKDLEEFHKLQNNHLKK